MLPGLPKPIAQIANDSPWPTGTTWDPASKGTGLVLTNGNLTATGVTGTAFETVRGTSANAGKQYLEITVNLYASQIRIGLATAAFNTTTGLMGNDAESFAWLAPNGQVATGGTVVATYAAYTAGDVLQVAVDRDNRRIWLGKNGVWQNDPTNLFAGLSFTNKTWYPAVALRTNGDTATGNFNGPFVYPIPAGFEG